MATSTRNRLTGLGVMVVILALLIFTKVMWMRGQLTFALLGLVGAIFVLAILVAFWKNMDDLLDALAEMPGKIGDWLGENWATVIGSVLGVTIIILFGSMLWDAAKVAVGYEDTLTRPIASPTATATTSSSPAPAVVEESRVETITPRVGSPDSVIVEPGWRWDLVDPMPAPDQYTSIGVLNLQGDRIQKFWVRAPTEEVTMNVKLTKCITAEMCAW